MEEIEMEKLITASENVGTVLLLSILAENAIESGAIEKIWDLHLLFGFMKKLSKDALNQLRQTGD